MKKRIIIDEKHVDAIQAAIDEIQNNKRMIRTIAAKDVIETVAGIVKELGIPKYALNGSVFYVDLFAEKLPKAYKYKAMSTHFVIEFGTAGKAYLTNVCRDDIVESPYKAIQSNLSELTKQALIERFSTMTKHCYSTITKC